jgi:hypothetical protein
VSGQIRKESAIGKQRAKKNVKADSEVKKKKPTIRNGYMHQCRNLSIPIIKAVALKTQKTAGTGTRTQSSPKTAYLPLLDLIKELKRLLEVALPSLLFMEPLPETKEETEVIELNVADRWRRENIDASELLGLYPEPEPVE